jgi:hypothetical protein
VTKWCGAITLARQQAGRAVFAVKHPEYEVYVAISAQGVLLGP